MSIKAEDWPTGEQFVEAEALVKGAGYDVRIFRLWPMTNEGNTTEVDVGFWRTTDIAERGAIVAKAATPRLAMDTLIAKLREELEVRNA